jgi:hypothetical protein
MRLSGSLIRERARPVGLCLVVVSGAPRRRHRGAAGAAGGGRGGRGELSPFAKEALAVLRAPLDRLTPVTEATLRNPPPGDWLHWRRTYDGWAVR